MTAKHTPGPWTPEFGEAYRVRAQQDGGQVAIMMNLKGRHGLAGRRNGDEVAANARLIAAAPELLEALKACAAVCAGETMNKRGLISALEQARAAIAKATGEQT